MKTKAKTKSTKLKKSYDDSLSYVSSIVASLCESNKNCKIGIISHNGVTSKNMFINTLKTFVKLKKASFSKVTESLLMYEDNEISLKVCPLTKKGISSFCNGSIFDYVFILSTDKIKLLDDLNVVVKEICTGKVFSFNGLTKNG